MKELPFSDEGVTLNAVDFEGYKMKASVGHKNGDIFKQVSEQMKEALETRNWKEATGSQTPTVSNFGSIHNE